MRILQIITRSSLGGAQSVVSALANYLCQNHSVFVVAGEGDGKIFDMLDKRVKYKQCTALQRSLSPTKDLQACVELRRIYNEFQPDVVHLHSSKAGMLGRFIFPKSKIVYTVHGFDSIRIAFRKFLPIERFMQRRCTAIVGVSKYDERHLLEERINRGVSYIYNGIVPIEKDENLSWPIKIKESKVVLCIARLSPPKKHDLFLQVARQLPNVAFVWIGNQCEPDEQIPSNVYFLGNIPDAGRYCQLADVFVLPSNYEGLPMVILEAMSCGIPVVASNVGGVSEAVIDGVNGYVVNNTVDDFTIRLESLLENETLAEEMGKNGFSFFKKEFTVEMMASKYESIFRNINPIINR